MLNEGPKKIPAGLRELLAFGLWEPFFSGGTGDGLLGERGLLDWALAPQSSSHSLLCFLSIASIL